MHKTTPTRNERALIYFSESVITIGHESMNNGKLNFLRMCNSADEAATTQQRLVKAKKRYHRAQVNLSRPHGWRWRLL